MSNNNNNNNNPIYDIAAEVYGKDKELWRKAEQSVKKPKK
jgi:hypothetical protein